MKPSRQGRSITQTDIDRAKEFISAVLANGSQSASSIEEQAKQWGVSSQTLESAKSQLKILASRSDNGHGGSEVHLALA